MRSTCCRSTAPTRSGCRTSTADACCPRCSTPATTGRSPPITSAAAPSCSRRRSTSDLEGLIAKRLDSTYRPGSRSKDWLKIKNRIRTDVVIGGFTAGTGARSTTFGALLVGVPRRRTTALCRRRRHRLHAGDARRAGRTPPPTGDRDVPVRPRSPGRRAAHRHVGAPRAHRHRRDRRVHQRRPRPPRQLRRARLMRDRAE